MADVSRIREVHSFHRDTELLPGVGHVLNLAGLDDEIGLGIEVELGPARGRFQQGIVMALVDEAGQGVQQDPQHNGRAGKSEQQEILEQHVHGDQDSCQGTKASSQVSSARGAIENGASYSEVLKRLVGVERLDDVTVQHDTPIAENVEKNRSVFNTVVKEQLQESPGWGLQGSDAKGFREEYHSPWSRVTDDGAPLRTTERDPHTHLGCAANYRE